MNISWSNDILEDDSGGKSIFQRFHSVSGKIQFSLNISYVCVCILGTPVIILRILNGTRCSNIKLRVNNIYRVFALLVSVFLVNDKWEEESGRGRETNGSKSTT